MEKEWVNQKIEECEKEFQKRKKDLLSEIQSTKFIKAKRKKEYQKKIEEKDYFILSLDLSLEEKFQKKDERSYSKVCRILDELRFCPSAETYTNLLDSNLVFFDGDIIITDPCYVKKNKNDWDRCDGGRNLDVLGIHSMTRDTIYGNWSCTVLEGENVLGHFCSDSSMVGVLSLSDVLAYNPNFDYHVIKPFTTTWIKDFQGTVQFLVKEELREKKNPDYTVSIVGKGINKITGEPMEFCSVQTGF